MTVFVSDTFNTAGSTAVGGRLADVGGTWEQDESFSVGAVSGGFAANTNGDTSRWINSTAMPDLVGMVRAKSRIDQSGRYVRIFSHGSNSGSDAGKFDLVVTQTVWTLYSRNAGTGAGTVLASGAVSFALGQVFTMEMRYSGSAPTTLRAYINGVEVTDPGTPPTSSEAVADGRLGRVGYELRNSAVDWIVAGDVGDPDPEAAGDTTAPTITGSITVGTVTTTSIQMSWPAGADNTAVTSYEVSSNGGGAWSDVGLVLTHTFTGLTAATSYGLRVRPKDAAGNVAVTPLSATQSTASSADTTVPTQSGSITVGTVTSTSIQFSWPAGADNVAVTAYEVSSNGGGAYTSLGNVLTHTFTGLTPSTSYGLRVRAKDAAGNVSTPALAATQSTSAAAPGSGTLTLTGFAQWTGSPVVSVSVPFVKVCRISTGAVVLELTAQAISGAGAMSITNAALSPAVDYMVFGFNADGSASFKKKVTAS